MRAFLRALALVICVSFVLPLSSKATVTAPSPLALVKDTSANWVLQAEKNGIKAYYKISTCGLFSVVLIKFVNETGSPVTVTWDEEATVQGSDTARRVNAEPKVLTVSSGTLAAESCETAPLQSLISRGVSSPVDIIASFAFLNLQITPKQ